MKKGFRIIAVIAVFALIISAFCACEFSLNKDDKTSEPTVITDERPPENDTVATVPTQPSSTSASEKVEIDSLDTILNNIKDYPAGTAGSTAKAYQIAYKVLNFTQNSNFTIDEVQQDYVNFTSTLSDTQKLIYAENLAEIDFVARKIINNPDVLNQYIENFRPISADGTITLSNYEALYVIISK